MKPVQVMFDEQLLSRLDATSEVRREGRSAVVRRATEEYLRDRRRREIANRFRRAYAGGAGLDEDFEGWENEGVWPES